MNTKSPYFTTGIFVVVGIVLFCACIMLLSKDESIFSSRVRLHSYFDDVEGLMYGSIVSFSGINVGNVKAINYDEKSGRLKVEYSVKRKFLSFITADSIASLRTQGALGDRFVFLEAGKDRKNTAKAGQMIESKAGGDLFSAVQEKIDGIPNLQKIGQELEKLVTFLNSEDGLRGVSTELRKTIPELKKTIKGYNQGSEVKKAAKSLNAILGKVEKGEGTLGRLITDPTLFDKVNGMLGGKQTSGYLKNLARKSIEKVEEKQEN